MRAAPDALNQIVASHHGRRVVDQLAENLRLQRRQADRVSFHHDLATIAREGEVVAADDSTRPGIDQGGEPPDHVAAGNVQHHGVRQARSRVL